MPNRARDGDPGQKIKPQLWMSPQRVAIVESSGRYQGLAHLGKSKSG